MWNGRYERARSAQVGPRTHDEWRHTVKVDEGEARATVAAALQKLHDAPGAIAPQV